ncbi:MAG: hypothetical protein JNK85_13855 [Verrucomicrobiales bacterium]|nr:hypothetical protein [Verrucomicrobiales bacterium]
MDLSAFIGVLEAMRRDLAKPRTAGAVDEGASSSTWNICELSAEVGLQVVKDSDGHERVVLIEGTPQSGALGASLSHHKLTLKLAGSTPPEGAGDATTRKRAVSLDSVIIADAEAEAGAGGDEATLLRRLEIVLGGPPGFTTGAKAEILADLLREFGRAALVENLQRVWVSQFDTGADTSASVTKG